MKRITIICILLMMVFGSSAVAFRLDPIFPGWGCPMDARLTEGEEEMFVVCDRDPQMGEGGVLRFEWVDGDWKYREELFSGLQMAHTLNLTPGGNLLISDSMNDRVLIVDPGEGVIWNSEDYGIVVEYPNDAELRADGNRILICENGSVEKRIVEIDIQSGDVTWEYSAFPFDEVHDCDYLENDNVIFVLSLSKTCLEVNRDGEKVWDYGNPDWGWVRNVERLPDGNTLVADDVNIYSVTPEYDENVVFSGTGSGRKQSLYNIHTTSQGVLCSTGLCIFMVNDGEIVWRLFGGSNRPHLIPPMSFDRWRMLKVLGYIK